MNTLFVTNFDSFFPFEAQKCMHLGPRCLWFCKQRGDAVLLYADPGEEYLQYVESVLGFMPEVYFPSDLNAQKELIPSVLADAKLLGRMRDRLGGYKLDPLYQCRGAVQLASRLRLNPQWRSTTCFVEKGGFEHLNDKSEFMVNAELLGVPVNQTSFLCEGRVEIEEAMKTLIAAGYSHGVVKATQSAGGLRNVVVDILAEGGMFTAWDAPSIVESVVETSLHFSVFGVVTRCGSVALNGAALRHVENFESLGATLPQEGVPKNLLEEAKTLASIYAEEVFAPLEVHTPFDFDVSVTKDGALCFWETNVRRYATQVQEQIGQTLGYPVTRSNEGLSVSAGTTLQDALGWCDHVRKIHPESRVVITLPPDTGKKSMGVCICGHTHQVVKAAYDELVQMSHVETV